MGIGSKKGRPCKGQAGPPGSRSRQSRRQVSLTFRPQGRLNRANSSERFIFSTRRPVPCAGGQRLTARCARGRKSVWSSLILRSRVSGAEGRGPDNRTAHLFDNLSEK